MTEPTRVYLALLHYPVYNKAGDTIASAVCNLDLHDIARAAITYGTGQFYVITPLEDQRRLFKNIVSHWTDGFGGSYNPDRKAALEKVIISNTVETAIDEIRAKEGQPPVRIATHSRPHPNNITFETLSGMVETGAPILVMFGTAWGLTREFLDSADHVLAPLKGGAAYNHLSVRSAASIVLDRLFGRA